MKYIIYLCVTLLICIDTVSAQKHKHHVRHTASATLKGAKIAGPIGAAGGFVIGRHLDKKKARRNKR